MKTGAEELGNSQNHHAGPLYAEQRPSKKVAGSGKAVTIHKQELGLSYSYLAEEPSTRSLQTDRVIRGF